LLEPIEFIEVLRESDGYIETIYTFGGCYQFYKILKLLYPDAEAYKVKNNKDDRDFTHIVTKIKGKFYDIIGEVQLEDYFGYELIKERDIETLEGWSFSENACLNKECPSCKESINFETEDLLLHGKGNHVK